MDTPSPAGAPFRPIQMLLLALVLMAAMLGAWELYVGYAGFAKALRQVLGAGAEKLKWGQGKARAEMAGLAAEKRALEKQAAWLNQGILAQTRRVDSLSGQASREDASSLLWLRWQGPLKARMPTADAAEVRKQAYQGQDVRILPLPRGGFYCGNDMPPLDLQLVIARERRPVYEEDLSIYQRVLGNLEFVVNRTPGSGTFHAYTVYGIPDARQGSSVYDPGLAVSGRRPVAYRLFSLTMENGWVTGRNLE